MKLIVFISSKSWDFQSDANMTVDQLSPFAPGSIACLCMIVALYGEFKEIK